MKNTSWLPLVVFGLLSPLAAFCRPLPSTHIRKTSVNQVRFGNWENAYRISNSIVDVIVVPKIGRIMAYYFTGHAETDPLWKNPAQAGNGSAQLYGWVNYGGDKLWPAPQSDWSLHGNKKGWPPDAAFDAGPYRVVRIKHGLRLIGPVSPNYQIWVSRDIVLPANSSRVCITDKYSRVSQKASPHDALSISIWNITEIRSDAMACLPVETSKGSNYVALNGTPQTGLATWKLHGNTLFITDNRDKSSKVGARDSEGWIAAVFGKNLVFSERFTYDRKATYLDHGTNAQIYTNPLPTPYIEMELLGPGEDLMPGKSMRRTIWWDLQRLTQPTPAPKALRKLLARH